VSLSIADNDSDDPIVWQRGKLLPTGKARCFVLRRSDEKRLVDSFGREWLDMYLSEKGKEIASWGVH